MFTVAPDHKPDVIRELSSGQGRTLAFTRTKHAARRLAQQLTDSGIPAVDLIDWSYPGHSKSDTLDKLSVRSMDAVGETLTEYLRRLH